LIGAALGAASWFVLQRLQVVWPWPIFQWSNVGLLLGASATGAGWLGWSALSLRWLNKRRQLGPGR
jgi:hypothetical protein